MATSKRLMYDLSPADLSELMKQWQIKSGDTLTVPTTSKPYEPIDLTGRKRTPDEWQPEWIVKKYF